MRFNNFWIIAITIAVSGVKSDDFGDFAKAQYLEQNSILYILSTFAQNVEISAECNAKLEELQEASVAKEAWALKMLDASGVRMPGFMFGQNFWLGDRQICETVRHSIHLAITERHHRNMHWRILDGKAPFDVVFNVAYMNHTSPWQTELKFLQPENVIHLGLCAPVACKIYDLKLLINYYLDNYLDEALDFYQLRAQLFAIKRLSDSWLPHMKFFQSPVFLCFACWTGLTFVCALCSVILAKKYAKQKGGVVDFMKCFDLVANMKKIAFVAKGTDDAVEISIINGLRVIFSIGILFMHIYIYGFPTISNRGIAFATFNNCTLLLAHLVVDVFFAVSGFLQAYKFLNNSQKLESMKEANLFKACKEFIKKIVHRWLRLAPLYYATICLAALISLRLNESSVYDIRLRDDLFFAQNWWRYLLFMHNFVDITKMAATWTWSLACEMQFFIFGTFLLLLFAKRPSMAKIGFLTMLAINIGAYYYNGYIYRFGLYIDDLVPTANAMYVNPLVRCTPYLMGVFCGWYLTIKDKRLQDRTECIIGHISLSILLVFIALLFIFNVPLGIIPTSILLIARLCLCVWICWLITAAVTKRKTWLNSFLELSWFRILACLSYAFYLIHPCILIYVTHTTDTGVHLDFKMLLILHLGLVLASYLGALLFTLIFEMPYSNLSSLILRPRKRIRSHT